MKTQTTKDKSPNKTERNGYTSGIEPEKQVQTGSDTIFSSTIKKIEDEIKIATEDYQKGLVPVDKWGNKHYPQERLFELQAKLSAYKEMSSKIGDVLDKAIKGVPKGSQTEAVLDVIKQELKGALE